MYSVNIERKRREHVNRRGAAAIARLVSKDMREEKVIKIACLRGGLIHSVS